MTFATHFRWMGAACAFIVLMAASACAGVGTPPAPSPTMPPPTMTPTPMVTSTAHSAPIEPTLSAKNRAQPAPTPWGTLVGTTPEAIIAELRNHNIDVQGDRCDWPSFCSSEVAPVTTLADYVAVAGAPDKVGSLMLNPAELGVYLVYASKGLFVLARRAYNGDYVSMTPTMQVNRIWFYKGRTLAELSAESKYHLEEAQDWAGFGPVKELR